MKTKPKNIVVRVTAKDIKKGIPVDPSYCPVAIACWRQFGVSCVVLTGERTIKIGEVKYSMPSKVRDFAQAFDLGCKVKTFVFKCKPIPQVFEVVK